MECDILHIRQSQKRGVVFNNIFLGNYLNYMYTPTPLSFVQYCTKQNWIRVKYRIKRSQRICVAEAQQWVDSKYSQTLLTSHICRVVY